MSAESMKEMTKYTVYHPGVTLWKIWFLLLFTVFAATGGMSLFFAFFSKKAFPEAMREFWGEPSAREMLGLFGGILIYTAFFVVVFAVFRVAQKRFCHVYAGMSREEQRELERKILELQPAMPVGKREAVTQWGTHNRRQLRGVLYLERYLYFPEAGLLFQPQLLRMQDVVWMYLTDSVFQPVYVDGEGTFSMGMPENMTLHLHSLILVTKDGRRHRVFAEDWRTLERKISEKNHQVIKGYSAEAKRRAREVLKSFGPQEGDKSLSAGLGTIACLLPALLLFLAAVVWVDGVPAVLKTPVWKQETIQSEEKQGEKQGGGMPGGEAQGDREPAETESGSSSGDESGEMQEDGAESDTPDDGGGAPWGELSEIPKYVSEALGRNDVMGAADALQAAYLQTGDEAFLEKRRYVLENCWLCRTTFYNSKGLRVWEKRYDEQGRPVTEISCDEKGESRVWMENLYDGEGRQTEQTIYRIEKSDFSLTEQGWMEVPEELSETEKRRWFYNEQGQTARRSVTDEYGETVTEYRYNTDGNCLGYEEKRYTDGEVNEDWYTFFCRNTYDAAGNLTESESGGGCGVQEVQDRFWHTYDGEGRLLSERTWSCRWDGLMEETDYTYDERGRIRTKKVFGFEEGREASEYTVYQDIVYEYDEADNCIGEKWLDEEGRTNRVYRYEREFDRFGNLIRYIGYVDEEISFTKEKVYDEEGKLLRETENHNTGSYYSYVYDACGNLREKNYCYHYEKKDAEIYTDIYENVYVYTGGEIF